MTTLMARVAGMPYGYDSPELKSISLTSRIFPSTSRLNIDDIQKPYNYLPKANEPYKEAKRTEIADKIQKLYDFYNPEIYNRTNATVLNIINQQIFDNSRKRVKWSKTLDFLESQIKKYADSLDAVSLNYLINLHNMLSPHVNKCVEKYKSAEDARYARDYLTKSASDLEKRHKFVSYNEAHVDLEEKAEVIPAARKSFVLNKTGGSPKSVYFKALGAIVLAAWAVTSSIGWWNSAREVKASKNKVEGIEVKFAGVLKEHDELKNEVSQLKTEFNSVKTEKSQLESEVKELTEKYNEEKAVQEQAAEEQKAESPKIPAQSSSPKTNFTFGHKTEDTLKLYSPKERSAMEQIVRAMDYKDPAKALNSLKRAKTYVDASGNQILANFYEGYSQLLGQTMQQGGQQVPKSEDKNYELLFNTVPPSQQQPNITKTKDKSLEGKIKQEEKGKKTVWQKTGDVIWDYTPISLVSVREWKRHPFRQTIKLVAAYFTGKGFGWWGKHAGGEVAAAAGAGGGEGVGGGGGEKVISTVLNLN